MVSGFMVLDELLRLGCFNQHEVALLELSRGIHPNKKRDARHAHILSRTDTGTAYFHLLYDLMEGLHDVVVVDGVT
jgi:hypothetical protein